MRIDKCRKVSRLRKGGTVANEAVKGGRVRVGGREGKPAYQLKIGDEVEIRFGDETVKFRVLSLHPVVKKDDASSLYEIIQ